MANNRRCRRGLLALFVACLMVSCDSRGLYNFDRQQEFEAQFTAGMTREEVEQKLCEIGDYEFVEKRELDNGDIRLEYRTESRAWGAPLYYFRFSPDDSLIVLFTIEPI